MLTSESVILKFAQLVFMGFIKGKIALGFSYILGRRAMRFGGPSRDGKIAVNDLTDHQYLIPL